jgi:hypothetical protein
MVAYAYLLGTVTGFVLLGLSVYWMRRLAWKCIKVHDLSPHNPMVSCPTCEQTIKSCRKLDYGLTEWQEETLRRNCPDRKRHVPV